MLSGVINVYKEKGYTSHDVVAKLRGIVGQKKIGHTGTLDPDAVGVLPVCLGKGTKLCGMLTEETKTYEALLLLGVATDTQDMSGQVLNRREVRADEAQVREAVLGFVGDYDQTPPMYSALKVGGKKLYQLARKGIEIEREKRRVRIEEIRILSVELPRVRMEVTCSKGTYIRTLCHDIGESLGCGGAMEELIRTRIGRFEMGDSLTLSQIEEKKRQGKLSDCIIPVDGLFSEYPAIRADEEVSRAVRNGNPFEGGDGGPAVRGGLSEDGSLSQNGSPCGNFRIYDCEGEFVGIYRYDEGRESYLPVRMFYDRG